MPMQVPYINIIIIYIIIIICIFISWNKKLNNFLLLQYIIILELLNSQTKTDTFAMVALHLNLVLNWTLPHLVNGMLQFVRSVTELLSLSLQVY